MTTPTPIPSMDTPDTPTRRALRRLVRSNWRPMGNFTLTVLMIAAWVLFFVGLWWLGR